MAVLIIALTVFVIASLVHVANANPTPPTGPTVNVGQPEVQTVKPCTVGAGRYNPVVRKFNAVKGYKARHGIHGRATCAQFRILKLRLKRARIKCKRNAGRTTASIYSWPDSGGTTGACGRYLGSGAGYKFAILQTGDVWGAHIGSPKWLNAHCFDRLYVHAESGGATIAGRMYDSGYGGPGKPGTNTTRGLDLFDGFGPALGIGGLGVVRYSSTNCW